MDCNNCNKVVPYIVHESDMARQERTINRLWVLLVIVVFMLVASNVGWLMYESQYEDQSITQDVWQDAESGDNSYNGNIIGGDYYGETESQNNG